MKIINNENNYGMKKIYTSLKEGLTTANRQSALRVLLLLLLVTIVGNAWGGSRYGRGNAYLKDGCPTGSGKVYVSVDSSSSSKNSGWEDCTTSGTSAQVKGAKTAMTFTFQAQSNSGYKFTGWYSKNADETYKLLTKETTYTVNKTTGAEPSGYSNAYTDVNCYAEFIKIVYYSFVVPEHGSYSITNNGVSVADYATIEAQGVVHLVSLPADGYRFAGWYTTTDGGTTKNYFSFDPEVDLTFTSNVTVGVDFLLDNGNALFYVVNGGMHDNLTSAITQAQSISPKVVTVAQDGRLASGSYTIPAAVSLLVPHNQSYTVQTNPELVSAESKTLAYRRLTLSKDANITCYGKICVGGKQLCAGGGKPSGYTTGTCGVIDMSSGGYIELNSGAKLYCWGFIKGQDMDQGNNTIGAGSILAKDGSEVWENFAVGDWRGGTACSNIQVSNFFPFQSYFIQNIEVPLTIKYGATNKCYAAVNANSSDWQLPAAMIGKEETLFKLTDANSIVRKWYDATTDLMCFELSGTANLDAVVVKGLPVIGNISSADYNLPISSNMHIILTNSQVTISKPMVIQPGAKIEIKDDAIVTISSNVFMYDNDEWGPYAGPNYYFHNYGNTYGILTIHKDRGNGKSKELLDDAQFIVDGQLKVTGKLYSTAGGADVMGNGGGKVVFYTLPTKSTTIDAFTGNGDVVSGGVTVNTANLYNEDDSYTKSIASTTFNNIHGRWFAASTSSPLSDHTYNFTYITSGQAVSGTGGATTSTRAIYGQDKTGLEAGMKWCNVSQDATCPSIYNATQKLHDTEASDIKYTYNSSEWLQLLKTETENVFGGSDNNLYAQDGCTITSLGSVDENCLYTIDGVKKALVDGHFVALAKNDDDEAFHNTANAEEYYISFAGCTWHPATKYVGEEKAYIVEDDDYIWYNNDWLLVEREEPFFFDYNDQNVKRYYEYENGAWVLAEPSVSVTDALETRYFYFLPEAFTVAFSKKNATITILKDVSGTSAQISCTTKNTTYTLDLNGHTASLYVTASGNSANLFAINAANTTFTITDNSANKDGVLDITTSLKVTKNTYHTRGIAVVDGSLVLNAGNVRLSNTYAYTSTTNSGMIKGINVAAGKSFTMNGGSIYAESPYYPRAINVEGSASANATVTINAGTIIANATSQTNAMGVYTVGGTTTIKEGVTINATTTTTSAYGIYVDASTSGYFGTLNMTGGTINATGATGTAIGVYVNGVYVSKNTTPNTFGANYKAVATISGGIFNVTTTTKATADGVRSYGTTNISGGTFTVTPKTTTAKGVYVLDGTTTIEGNPTFTVTATEMAYGIQAGEQPVEKTGRPYNGQVIVKGGTFTVNTTSKTTAYGVYVRAATRNTTNTASGYYPGHYASAGKATIESGTFNVTAKTTTAYGILVERDTPLYDAETNEIDAYAQGEAIVKGGKFTVVGTTTASKTPTTDGIRAYGNVTITGGEFDVTASGGYGAGLRIYNGKTTVSGNTKFTVKATTYAYGAVVTGVAPTAVGFNSNAEVVINNGTFDVATTSTTSAYGAFVTPIAPVATEDPDVFYKSPSTLTINNGQFTVTAQTTTAQGVNCSRGYLMAGTSPNVLKAENLGVATINGGTFDVTTLGSTTAQGITNSGNTTVSNATFNVTPKSTTAYGARCYHGLLTINEGTEFNVKATSTAYGIVAGNEQPTTAGLLYDAEVVINGGTINVETTSKATIHGLWASGKSRTIATGTASEGNYASAGKITVNGGEVNVKAKTNPAYAVLVDAVVTQSGNADHPAASATPQAFINGGKFYVTATSSKNYAVSSTPLAENCQITGGYYNTHLTQTSKTYIDKYIVSPNKKLTLRESHALYPDGYRYTVGEGGTVTWKNGTSTLLTENYIKGETPAYTGETPTKEADAQYTYTHDSWSPAITVMDNSDVTYSATYNSTIRQYDVTFDLQGHGSAIAKQTLNYDSKVTRPTDPTDADYDFGGWYKEEACTNAWEFASDKVTGTTTLYAKWTPSEKGDRLDIVDWSGNGSGQSLTLNMNGYSSDLATNKTGWKIKIGATEKNKNDREADRTLVFSGLSLPAGQEVTIEGYDANNTLETKHKYVIPQIITGTTTLSATQISYIFVRSGKLTVNGNIEVSKIVVCPGAELEINSGKTLTVTDRLVLRTRAFSSAVLTNNGTLSISDGGQMYYSRIAGDKSQTYEIGLPLDADLSKVIFSHGGEATQNSNFGLFSYDSEGRADKGTGASSNWVLVDGNTMNGKQGYQLMSTSAYYQEYLFPVTYTKPADNSSVAIAAYPSDKAQDQGWNYIVSPYTHAYEVRTEEPSEAVKICELTEDNTTFWQHAPSVIPPARPFYYQAQTAGTLSFGSTFSFVSSASSAPRRVAKTSSLPTQWIQLLYGKAGDMAEGGTSTVDETNIYLNTDKFTPEYETGYDVVKMSKTGRRPLLWSSVSCGDLAFAALPDEVLEAGIPLTVFSPEGGTMVFALEDNDFLSRIEQLMLYDAAEDRYVDLLYRDYTCYAAEGTTAGRFTLSGVISKTPQTTTQVNSVEDKDLVAWSADKHIYAERPAGAGTVRCYDAVGHLVGIDSTDRGLTEFSVPTAGVYILKAGDRVKRVVVW